MKVEREHWLSSPAKTFLMYRYLQKVQAILFSLVLLFLPTQLGKHFFPPFSYVSGIRVDYLSPTFYVTDLLIVLLFVVTLFVDISIFRQNVFRANKVLVLVFFLLSMGVFLSKNQAAGLYGLCRLVEFLFFGFYTARKVKDLQMPAVLFSIGIICESLLSVWQFLLQHSVGGLLYLLGERTFFGDTPGVANASISGQLVLRPYGTFPHPNVLAGFLVIAMTIIYFQKKNHLFLISLFLGTTALFLTLSRIAIASWVCEAVCLFIYNNRDTLTKKRRSIYGLIGFVIILFFALSPLGQRFFSGNLGDVSLVEREQQMLVGLRMFFDHPLLGVGINNYFAHILYYLKSKSVLQLQPVHNIYLLLLAQTGVVGFFFTIVFLKKTFQKISKTKSEARRMFFFLFSLLFVLGLSDHYLLTIQQGQLLTAFILGMLWSKNNVRFSIKSS